MYQQEGICEEEQKLFQIQGKEALQLPHCLIGAITFQDKNKNYGSGSGVMISSNLFLTAAHNLFNRRQDNNYANLKIFLQANGEEKYQCKVESWRYPEQYQKQQSLQFDYAIIKIKNPISLPSINQQFLPLSFACQECLMKNNDQHYLQVFGFPRSYKHNYKPLDEYGEKFMLHQYGLAKKNSIKGINNSKFRIDYQIANPQGHSGCPLITQNSIIAIHKGSTEQGLNVGRSITTDLVNNLQLWCKQLKGNPFKINQKNICAHLQATVKKYLGEKPIGKTQTKLDRSRQNIKEINIKEYRNLIDLDLSDNQLSAIDVTNNTNLTWLNLYNNQLSAIDATNNTNLTQLRLSNNQLSAIDVTINTKLTWLHLSNNQLSAIDVTNNTNLTSLHLSNNQLSAIDVTNNTNLTLLYLQNNQLSAIDVTKSSKLYYLRLQSNKISKISFWFSPQKPISEYLSWEYDFSHQRSDVCEVQIEYNSESEAKCSQLREKWAQKYQQGNTDQNKHKCKYVFKAVKE